MPLAIPLVWTVALVVLPSAALGRANPLAALGPFRRRLWAASAAVLVMLLTGAAGAVVALTSGLFLTGFLGGLVAWAWVGITGAALLVWWSRLLAARPHGSARSPTNTRNSTGPEVITPSPRS